MSEIKQIIIGRDVPNNKKNMFKTPEHDYISNTHAIITKDDNENFSIKDLSSSNGTYVNNIRVIESPIKISDVITLGGKKGIGYRLPLEQLILNRFSPSDTEFTERMNKLKSIFNDYSSQIDRLESYRDYIQILRGAPFALLALLKLISPSSGLDANALILFTIVGILLVASNIFITIYTKKVRKKIKSLREHFQIQYVCPSCRRSLDKFSWSFLESMKECPCCNRPFYPKQ